MAQTQPPPRKRRVLRTLLIVLAAVILLPVLAVVSLVTLFDADAAKPRIIAAVREATGRELVIAGPIRLVLALHPSVALTDVTLSNPPGFSRPQMATLKRLDLQLALLPLLSRRIEVDRLVFKGADILLETDAKGQGNWQLAPSPAATPSTVPSQPQLSSARTSGAFRIDKVVVEDSRIAYRGAGMAAPEVLAIRNLTLTANGSDQPFKVVMAADALGAPFTLSGNVGPLAALLGNAGHPVTLDLAVATEGASMLLAGSIADPVRLAGVDLRVKAAIPDLAALSGLARTKLPALRGISVDGKLADLAGKPGLSTGFRLHDLRVAFAQGQFDGEVTLAPGSSPLLHGKLQVARIDADALLAAAPIGSPPAGSATSPTQGPSPDPGAATPAPEPPRLIPDREWPLGMLRVADADLTLAIGEVIRGGIVYRDIAGHVLLRSGALRLDPFSAILPGGPAQFTLSVDAAKPTPPVAITISAPSLSLAPLLTAFRLPSYGQGNLWVNADLRGVGRSAHQLAATLDGSIGLSMENAQIDAKVLGDLLKGLNVLGNGKAGLIALRCLAVRMEARNGAATLRTLLLDTAPAHISGSGGLNLGQETLAIRAQTTIRMGDTAIAAPIEIGGTFLAPRLKVDTAAPLAGLAAGAAGNNPFGIIIGRLGLDQFAPGATGQSCANGLAIAHGETPPPEPAAGPQGQSPGAPPAQPAIKPPNPADLLRQLFR